MNITLSDAENLLKEEQSFAQIGFSMLIVRLKKIYAENPSELTLQKCADEINAFLNKFKKIMAIDYERILKISKQA